MTGSTTRASGRELGPGRGRAGPGLSAAGSAVCTWHCATGTARVLPGHQSLPLDDSSCPTDGDGRRPVTQGLHCQLPWPAAQGLQCQMHWPRAPGQHASEWRPGQSGQAVAQLCFAGLGLAEIPYPRASVERYNLKTAASGATVPVAWSCRLGPKVPDTGGFSE